METPRLTFWDFARAVINRRRLIFVSVLAVMILSVVIASFMPKWYRATALILPPEKQSDFGGMMGLSGLAGFALSGSGFSLPVLASESDVIASMLRSRTVIDAVIDSLHLMSVYNAKRREEVRAFVGENLNVRVGNDGVIRVEFTDKDSNRCAEVANAVIAKMDRLRSDLLAQKARETRRFVEQKLAENQIEILMAEDSLVAFQKLNRVIQPELQATASIEAAANLRAAMIAKQIEMAALQATHSSDHPQVIALRNGLSELERKITELESGLVGTGDSSSQFSSIPFADVPDLSLRYGQLLRDLRTREKVFELLTEQLEHAKIQETRETPTISVLDWAVPPHRKLKPKRATIGLVAGFLTLAAVLSWMFAAQVWDVHRRADSSLYKNLSGILSALRRDLFGLRNRKL